MEKQIDYLKKMTDDFGIFQFSNKNTPDSKSGYTIDDNARALIVSSKLNLNDLSHIYFDFIKNAQISNGKFVNVYSEKRNPLEKYGSQDSFGRTLWALGEYLTTTGEGAEISKKSVETLERYPVKYPASESFVLLGLTKMHNLGFEKQKTNKLIKKFSNSLLNRINKYSDKKWFWISDEMSYENARIPQSLLRSYTSVGELKYFYNSKNLANFLDETVFEKNFEKKVFLNVVGNNTSGLKGTWHKKGSPKPKYDEQPVDAGGMVELHSEIYNLTRNQKNLELAKISMDWFNGRNRLNKKMISPEGGIYDGLNKDYVNPNQGSESLLAYMMAKIKLNEITKNGS